MLVGREPESDRLVSLVDGSRVSSCAVVVTGQPGIGKTALLGVALERALVCGFRVLGARPTRAETPLAFAVLADLLRDVDLAALTSSQRRVLEIALGRRDNDGDPPLASELGMALVATFGSLALGGPPVAIAIDDVQWVDAATRELLAFAMRRLPAAGVCVLVTLRTGSADALDISDVPDSSAGLSGATHSDRSFVLDVPECEAIEMRPLPSAAIEQVVRNTLSVPLPGPALQRVVAVSNGNPLLAIEFARSMGEAAMHPARPLPVPTSLGSVIAGRFHALPARTLEALAAVAMLARPSVAALSDLGLVDDLAPAELAHIVEVRRQEVMFTHPVFASAAYDAIPGTLRLHLHRRLASVASGTERCIHLALGATHPDAAVAAELTAAAEFELGRGATGEAADLAMLALGATPPDDLSRWERMIIVGNVLFRAGHTDDAVGQVEMVCAEAPESLVRARALLLWATIEYSRSADADVAARLARRCIESTDDRDLLAEAHSILARVLYTDFALAAEHADAALEIVRARVPVEPRMLAQALTASAATHFNAGDGLDRAALEQAIELEAGTSVLISDSAYACLAALLKYADELDEAYEMFTALTEQSDPGSLPYALGHLPQLHLWTGRWDEAERCARRHLELAEQTQQQSQVETAQYNLAAIAAHRGDVDEAEPLARALFEEGRDEGVPWTERIGASLLGFLAMTTGDAEAATEYFGRYDELGEMMRLHEPGMTRFHGDFVEALVAIGDVPRAVEVLDRVGERAERVGRISSQAWVLRGRALVAAHVGDRDLAFAAARQAIVTLHGTPLAYDQSRALLTLGMVARRFKERSVARQTLEDALDRFEHMGAASLAERARRELDRIGGRSSNAVAGITALSATETSVAELAAAGRTTRQIADTLFIKPKTVEANLTRVYRKLGLSNRAQLANHVTSSRSTRSAG